MANGFFFSSLLLVALLFSSSHQLGTLWVNQINGNSDTGYVQIEESIINGNTVEVTNVNALSSVGVNINGVVINDGNINIPNDFSSGGATSIAGLFTGNGELSGTGFGNSKLFLVDTNGDMTTAGILFPNGGISVGNNLFTVNGISGETTIASAPYHANGGINVNNGIFTVDGATGDVLTEGNLSVELDIVLGSSASTDNHIRREMSEGNVGGDTHISGQSGSTGGNLVLEPGYATIVGQILVGRADSDKVNIGRVAVQSGNGGSLTFSGQSSSGAAGGSLYVRAGDSGSVLAGGDLVLAPGISYGSTTKGEILLGTDNPADVGVNQDLLVTRSAIGGSDGGVTTFAGQDTANSMGGDVYLVAGSGATTPGDIFLQPGESNGITGNINLGDASNYQLDISVISAANLAGDLYIRAQDFQSSQGGDLHLTSGGGVNAGDIYFVSGNNPANNGAASVLLGAPLTGLSILRPDTSSNAGSTTTFAGQYSPSGVGGDVEIIAGSDSGGEVVIIAGQGNLGGDIEITAGSGGAAGGNISFTSNSYPAGSIYISPLNQRSGGNVHFSAGSGSSGNGRVVFDGPTILSGDLRIVSSDLNFLSNSCPNQLSPLNCSEARVIFRSSASHTGEAVFSVLDATYDPNPRRIIRSAVKSVNLPLTTTELSKGSNSEYQDAIAILNSMQGTTQQLIDALSDCGHGLIEATVPKNGPGFSSCQSYPRKPYVAPGNGNPQYTSWSNFMD